MSYKYVTRYTSPNKSGDFRAESITIHWWGEPRNHRSGKIGGVVNWLCQKRARASAHFVVSGVTREIACIVGLNKAAWHSANWTGNHRSVGIEMHPFDGATPAAQREADLEAAAYVVALIWHWKPATKDKPLKGHRDWHNTECPGDRYYSHLDEIRRRARKLYPRVDPDRPGVLTGSGGGTTKPLPDPKPTPTPKEWFDMASKQELREVIAEYLGDVIPRPTYDDGKDETWDSRNVASYTLSHAFYARQNVYTTLKLVEAIAAKTLTKAEIEAASRAGTKAALDAKIAEAKTTLVVKENQ